MATDRLQENTAEHSKGEGCQVLVNLFAPHAFAGIPDYAIPFANMPLACSGEYLGAPEFHTRRWNRIQAPSLGAGRGAELGIWLGGRLLGC